MLCKNPYEILYEKREKSKKRKNRIKAMVVPGWYKKITDTSSMRQWVLRKF